MSYQEEMLLFNKRFVENKEYERFITTKYPERKIAILTCMDTRLIELLPAALNLKMEMQRLSRMQEALSTIHLEALCAVCLCAYMSLA